MLDHKNFTPKQRRTILASSRRMEARLNQTPAGRLVRDLANLHYRAADITTKVFGGEDSDSRNYRRTYFQALSTCSRLM